MAGRIAARSTQSAKPPGRRGCDQDRGGGQAFEPWEHEAIFYEETAESEEGLVLKVFRDGYRQHDRIVRPAQVSVAKAPEAQHQAETTLEEE